MSEYSHGIFALYCLFAELLLPRTVPMPWSQIKTLLLEVAEFRMVVCSGGSRHHMFHLPAKSTRLDALWLKVLKRSKHNVWLATVNYTLQQQSTLLWSVHAGYLIRHMHMNTAACAHPQLVSGQKVVGVLSICGYKTVNGSVTLLLAVNKRVLAYFFLHYICSAARGPAGF